MNTFLVESGPRTSESEQSEILWGLNARNQTPVLIPREVLREHAHFLGDTGSGKTSLGISPLVSQLLKHGDCSVIVMDLKGDDQSLFELLRIGAQETSKAIAAESDSKAWSYPFSYFAVDEDKPCHIFNPFQQPSFRKLSALQQTDLLTTALGLRYGTDYGRKYFGDANFDALLKTLSRESQIGSFSDLVQHLHRTMNRFMDREGRRAASNLIMSVERLASVPPLNATPVAEDEAINLGSFFEKPQAAYFSLPAATGSVISSDIGRLLFYGLIDAAKRARKPRCQVFLVIDEFQRMVSNNVEVMLQMARSLDIGVILSN